MLAGAFVTLLLAGCGGTAHPGRTAASPTPSPGARQTGAQEAGDRPSDADRIQALLARRARALEAGDAAALAATATGRQRRRDMRAARRCRALPLREVRIAAQIDELGDRARLRLRTSYRLAGAQGRFESVGTALAVRTAAGWRMAREGTGARDRPPWEVGTYRAYRSAHFLVLSGGGARVARQRGRALAAALEAARGRLRSALPGVHAPARLAVLLAADPAQLRALTRRIRGVESLAAITDAGVREFGPARRVVAVAGLRLIVVRSAYRVLDPAGQARVLTHELTHAALAARTTGRTPAWLVEGVALYASDDQRAGEVGRLLRGDRLATASAAEARAARRSASLRALAGPEAIARRSGLPQAVAYAYASAAAFAIAASHGRAALLRLYDAFGDAHLRGGPGATLDDSAVRKVLHVSLRRLEQAVRAYAIARAG